MPRGETTGGGRYRVEYLNRHGWWTGHHGIDLPDPEDYVAGLNERPNTIARIIDKETGTIMGAEVAACPLCETVHAGPHDGRCLL